MKEYVAACSAVESFVEKGKMNEGAINGVRRFLVLSLGMSCAFIGLAVAFAYWGGDVSPLVAPLTASNFFGWPTKEEHACYMNASDTASFINGSTVVTTLVQYDGLLVAKNLYCGLMLGLVFGFLDNFGLFYGMENLEPILYRFGTNVISGAMSYFRDGEPPPKRSVEKDDLIAIHNAADKLMAGLGNTFRCAGVPCLTAATCVYRPN